MPNVMAAQPNIGGAVCESSIIPFLILCYKVWLTAAARVPCSNTANIGERKTWTLSEFCKIPLGSKSPKNVYIKERKGRVFYSAFLAKVIHSQCSGMDHTVLPANNTMPTFLLWAFTRCHHHSNWGSGHPIAAHYSFIDPERMKGSVGLVGWPIADGLPT